MLQNGWVGGTARRPVSSAMCDLRLCSVYSSHHLLEWERKGKSPERGREAAFQVMGSNLFSVPRPGPTAQPRNSSSLYAFSAACFVKNFKRYKNVDRIVQWAHLFYLGVQLLNSALWFLRWQNLELYWEDEVRVVLGALEWCLFSSHSSLPVTETWSDNNKSGIYVKILLKV